MRNWVFRLSRGGASGAYLVGMAVLKAAGTVTRPLAWVLAGEVTCKKNGEVDGCCKPAVASPEG